MRVADGSRLALLAFTALLALAAPALGYPLLGGRPAGGSAFEGPADFDVTALWWNPAGLGALHGKHLLASGVLLGQLGSLERSPIDPSSGTAGGGATRSFPSQSLSDLSLRGFAGGSWDFGTDTITFGFAVLAPWDSTPTFAPPSGGGLLPSSYHLVSERFRALYVSGGLGLRLHPQWLVGVAISAIDTFADYTFYRDGALDGGAAGVSQPGGLCGAAACGYENPLAAQRVRVHADGGSFWGGIPIPSGIGMNWGILTRPIERLWIGASWQHVFPLDARGSGYDLAYELPGALAAEVTPAPGQNAPCGGGPCRGAGSLAFSLPDVFHVGARAAATEKLEIEASARLAVYGGYGASDDPALRGLVLRFGGDPVTRAGLPERVVLARALRPQVTLESGARLALRPALRLGGSLLVQTAAVPERYVNAEAIDGVRIDLALSAEWRPRRWVRVIASYGFAALVPPAPSPGVFDPSARVRCAAASYASDACTDDLAGRAHPTAAGRYTEWTQRGAVGVGLDF